jgi:tRNA A-37 threonylcarbamoyl transferase component Bud32
MMSAPGAADREMIKVEPRTLIWAQALPEGGRAVIKMYRRRAFYDPLRRALIPYRVQREYELLAHLRRSGVPCAEPLWWSHGRDRREGRYELLATRELAGTAALADLLRSTLDLAPLFQLARRMHECGVAHGSFYPTNILVAESREAQPSYHLIDFAHGCRFANSIVGSRVALFDLLDMLRAIERRRPLDGHAQWIAGYGLDATAARRLLARFESHRLERPWRHLRRAETDTRAGWHRVITAIASRTSPGAAQNPPRMRPG